jgi:hypothetical protein
MIGGSIVSPGVFAAKVASGDYQPIYSDAGCGTAAPTANTAALFVSPWFGTGQIFTKAAIYLATLQAGAGMMAGVYDWNDGQPIGAQLLQDFGEIDLTAGNATIREASPTVAWRSQRRAYWLASWLKASTTSPTVMSNVNPPLTGVFPFTAILTTTPARGFRLASAYPASMPANLPAGLIATTTGQLITMLKAQ